MKHKLKISVSNNTSKKCVDNYKKVSPDANVKDLIRESNKVIIIVLGDSVKYKRIWTLIDLNCALLLKARKLRSINTLIIGQ